MLAYCGYFSLVVITAHPTHSPIHMPKNCEEATTLKVSRHDFLIQNGMYFLKGLSDGRELPYGW